MKKPKTNEKEKAKNWDYIEECFFLCIQNQINPIYKRMEEAELILKRVREHRAEYSQSRAIDWIHELDRILDISRGCE